MKRLLLMTIVLFSFTTCSWANPAHPKPLKHHKTKHHVAKRQAHKTLHTAKQKHIDPESEQLAKNLDVPNLNVPAYFFKEKPATTEEAEPIKSSISNFLSKAVPHTNSTGFVSSMQQHLVNFVRNTVSTLRYSDYKLGGKKFDVDRGIYVVDCSSFVDHILQAASPHSFDTLVNATGAPTPASQHYYDFFSELTEDSNHYWNKVPDVNSLRPGDILVFRYKNSRGSETGGHVMVVMDKPIRDTNVFYVRVADSAPTRHSQDTRQHNEAGIGIGTLLLKVNPETGKPSAFAWGIGSYWNKNVKFAMARPTDAV